MGHYVSTGIAKVGGIRGSVDLRASMGGERRFFIVEVVLVCQHRYS